MVGDHYNEFLPKKWPDVFPEESKPKWPVIVGVSRDEFELLKRDVEEMKALLKRAKEYDERNHEPDCEIEEKMELLRKIAKAVGVDIDEVIGSKHAAP